MSIVDDVPELLKVTEAAEILRIGRSKLYDLIRTNQLKTIKIGRCRRVPRASIADVVRTLSEEYS